MRVKEISYGLFEKIYEGFRIMGAKYETKLISKKIISTKEFINLNDIKKKMMYLKGRSFIIDNKSCSIFFENIIKSKFKIIQTNMTGYQNDNWETIYDPINKIKKSFSKESKKNEDKLLQGVCLIGD